VNRIALASMQARSLLSAQTAFRLVSVLMTACRSANRLSDISAMLATTCPSLLSSSSIVPADNTSSTFPLLGAMCDPVHAHGTSIFHCQQNLKLYRSLVAASEAAAAKADTRQKKQLKLLAKEVANEPPARKN
jgi:hypothetical protein